MINNLLHRFGLDTINFFTTNRALFSVIFTQIWQWTGWAMVIFLANLQSIAPELYEAAQIDGANGRQSFFRITLPLMCPSVKIIVVTGLIGGMKAFDAIYSMTSGGPGNGNGYDSYDEERYLGWLLFGRFRFRCMLLYHRIDH